MEYKGVKISWLGHASFLLEQNDTRVYIDPYQIGRTRPDADIIFITHDHYDHLSIEDIDTISTDETIIVVPESCREKLEDLSAQLTSFRAGETKDVSFLTVTAVAAYNTNKKFHPKEKGWLGYVLGFDKATIYHAGDTDVIDEMDSLNVDVALLPVSGTYVMTPQEAVKAAKKVGAKHAVPMHYGTIVGDVSHAQEFKKLCKAKVTVLEKA